MAQRLDEVATGIDKNSLISKTVLAKGNLLFTHAHTHLTDEKNADNAE